MLKLGKIGRRLVLIACVSMLTTSMSGCELARGFLVVSFNFSRFFRTTPLIPVSPYWSQLIEDTYHEEERYDKVPVLDPVEGEHAPLVCLDPPSPDEVIRTLPDKTGGGAAFIAETSRNNVRIIVEPIVDKLGECRQVPHVGPVRKHSCHYKCTVYYDRTIRSWWPVPFSHKDETQEVVYIDHDHFIRCAGGPSDLPPVIRR